MVFKKKKVVAIFALFLFMLALFVGFKYWQYTKAPGKWKTFTGKVSYSPDIDTVCKFFEIDKDILVRVSCNKEQIELYNQANIKYWSDKGIDVTGDVLNIAPFMGQYDKSIKQGDTVTVKAVKFGPNGLTKYKMYEIRETGTYVKKIQ